MALLNRYINLTMARHSLYATGTWMNLDPLEYHALHIKLPLFTKTGFYLVALVFIVFDAVMVFLFPWALVLRDLGVTALAGMGVFMGIVLLGWVYAYREGILEWK